MLRESGREAGHEAYTASAWGGGLSPEIALTAGAETVFVVERNMSNTVMRGAVHPAGVEEPITRTRIAPELGRSRVWPSPDDSGGPHREGEEP